MSLYEILGTVEIGLIFALVALGAYLTFKILDFPDLTVEGSFPLGAAIAAVLIIKAGWNPWAATGMAIIAGYCAGFMTALLNVRFNILHILAGILVAVSLYSINLRVMDGPNEPLLGATVVYTSFEGYGVPGWVINPIFLGVVVLGIKFLLDAFLSTGVGLSMRATGANPHMAEANGINIGKMKLHCVGVANGMTALSGALFAQVFGGADAYMGIGVIITGLASVIVGLSLLPSHTMFLATLACIIGSLLYRAAVGLALHADFLGFRASDLQFVTAALVAITLIIQNSRGKWKNNDKKNRDIKKPAGKKS